MDKLHTNHSSSLPQISPDEQKLSDYLTRVKVQGVALAVFGSAVIAASVLTVPAAFVLSGGTAAIAAIAAAILGTHAGGALLHDGINLILEASGNCKKEYMEEADNLPSSQNIEGMIEETVRPKIQESAFLRFLVP